MRILHINKTYYPDTFGGIEQCIYQLCEGCASHGIDSHVLTLSRNAQTPILSLGKHTVHRARLDLEIASTGFSLPYIHQFIKLSSEADILHYQFPWPFSDMVRFITTTKIKKPYIITYQSDIVKQKRLLKLYAPLRDDFLKKADCIVTTSPNYLRTSDVLRPFRDRVKIIPIGIDRERYPVPTADCISKWRKILPERFFLFIGATRYYKGLHILLDALGGADYPLVILGSGPCDAALKAQASKLGLKNSRFLGALPDEDKMAVLKLSYAVVLPSHIRTEAFGICLLEGAMYGKPLISTEIGTGTTYINVDGETGLVAPPDNPGTLKSAMYSLWKDPCLAESMGRRAHARYLDVFTADRMVQSYIEIYKELLA